MPTNVTPVYVVTYDGVQLPGYAQTDNRPIVLKSADDDIFGRDGFVSTSIGAAPRKITMSFLIKSTLDSGSGLDHLDNVMDQYRVGLRTLTRQPGMKRLMIHDSDRYYSAKVDAVSDPLDAKQARSITYNVDFTAQPWAFRSTAVSASFSGNGSLQLNVGTDSRITYPQFSIGPSITALTVTDENSKVLSFTRGAAAGSVVVSCAELRARIAGTAANAISTIGDLDFGLYYDATDGLYDLTITGFAGTGSVLTTIIPRYEL